MAAQAAFQQLKDTFSSTSVLRLPYFLIPFIVETNASGVGGLFYPNWVTL